MQRCQLPHLTPHAYLLRHTIEWVYRVRYGFANVIINYDGQGGSAHESEVDCALFPDRTTVKTEENPAGS